MERFCESARGTTAGAVALRPMAREPRCFLFSDKDGVIDKEPVADTWLGDLRADENGYLLTDVDSRQIDSRFTALMKSDTVS